MTTSPNSDHTAPLDMFEKRSCTIPPSISCTTIGYVNGVGAVGGVGGVGAATSAGTSGAVGGVGAATSAGTSGAADSVGVGASDGMGFGGTHGGWFPAELEDSDG